MAGPPNDHDNNLEQLRQHALLLDNALDIVASHPSMSQEALLDYVYNYRNMTVAFIAQQLSKALYAAMPLPPRSSHSILISHIVVLIDCGTDWIDRMSGHFANSAALCNLGNAYFALGGNPERYLVIQMLAAMAARNIVLPVDFHADCIVFDVLVDFIGGADTSNEKTALALHALRDLCAVSENTQCAAMRGSVEVLVEALIRSGNDLKTVGATMACEAALGALRFLLYSGRGRAAFASHSQSKHVIRAFMGTVSAPITDAVVLCVATMLYSFPLIHTLQCMQPHPRANPSYWSGTAQRIFPSLMETLRTYINEHAPNEEDIVSVFQ